VPAAVAEDLRRNGKHSHRNRVVVTFTAMGLLYKVPAVSLGLLPSAV